MRTAGAGGARRPTRRSAVSRWAAGSVVVAVAAVVAIVVAYLAGGASPSTGPAAWLHETSSVSASVLQAVENVPGPVERAVGTPGGDVVLHPTLMTRQPPLDIAAKPGIVYVGAEFCPYCAAERWPLVQALSRFGHFSGLSETTSSSTDVYPSTATFSFHGATYTSPYVSFAGAELYSNVPAPGGGYERLDRLDGVEQAVFDTYDAPPFTTQRGAFPFLDIANRGVLLGADYDPGVLQGLDSAQIAAKLRDATSPVAVGILGAANYLTAVICDATGGRPSAVCGAPEIVAAAHAMAEP